MGMKIVASAGQPFAAGSRVKFSVVGFDDASGSAAMADRKRFWQATRLSGPREKPVGFSLPQCVLMTDVVEFPVEPGEWILMAKNGKDPSVKFHYTVGAVSVPPKMQVPFSDLDPEFVLRQMRKSVENMGKLKCGSLCAPDLAVDNTRVAASSEALGHRIREAEFHASLASFDALLAKSRGTRRYALQVTLGSLDIFQDTKEKKSRTLLAFASQINGVWSITDWTSLGRNGSATIYARPQLKYDARSRSYLPASAAEDIRAAISLWQERWPYGEGTLVVSGQVEGLKIHEFGYVETPGKDAAKWSGFLDAVSMMAMFAGFIVPPLFVLSMVAGAGASVVRINESLKQGKRIEDNLLDVLFLVASATSMGRMAAGVAGGMSRVASVATTVKGRASTYMTWADDVANGACFVMMTPEVYDLTTDTLGNDSLTASQKLERLATGLMPMLTMGGILIHNVAGKKIGDFAQRVLDPKATIRPTELLAQKGHTNERTNKTQVGRKERGVDGEGFATKKGKQGSQIKEMDGLQSKQELRTYGDHLREEMGPGMQSHPEEVKIMISELNSLGVEVKFSSDRLDLMYDPGLRQGEPGTIKMDADASFGAIRHEWRHAMDDAASGFQGFRLMMDSEVFWRLEFRGYMEEIRIARTRRSFGVAKKIIKEMRMRKAEILRGEA